MIYLNISYKFFICLLQVGWPKPPQASKMESFATVVKGFKPLTTLQSSPP